MQVLPEVFSDEPGATFLRTFLQPFQELLDEVAELVEVGVPTLLDVAAVPGPVIAALHAPDQLEQFTQACLDHLASWLGITLRPPPARSVEWNRTFLRRSVDLLPLRGTLPGIDGLLRAWLDGDVVGGASDADSGSVLVVTDLAAATNGGGSAMQLGATATLGVDTVLGEAPDDWLVVDLVLRDDVEVLRHPVGVDAVRRAALALLEAERPAHVHGELRLRGRTLQLAPEGDPSTWGDAPPPYARLADPGSDLPDGTAMVWDDPWVARFPDETIKGSAW